MIKKLNLSNTLMHHHLVASLCNCLKDNFTLQELNTSNNKLSDEDAKEIGEVIKCNSLIILDISYCGIAAEGAAIISYSMKNNDTLLQLNMSNNKFGFEGTKEFAKILKFNVALQKLDISDCGNVVAVLCDSLKKNTTLKDLKMSHSKITISEIAEIVEFNSTLQKLDISYCAIVDDEKSIFSYNLDKNSTLQELNISHINISFIVAEKIAKLVQITTLLKIDISFCNIADDGLANIIGRLKNIKELNMSHNMISTQTARKIVKVIGATNLNKLDISNCDIANVKVHVAVICYCIKFLKTIHIKESFSL